MTAPPIGHNSKHIDEVPMLDAIGRQRWALMDPRCPLTAIQRGIGQVIVNHIDAFGEGVRLSYDYLAGCAGLANRESARYHTEDILEWMGFKAERNSSRSSYRWSSNISSEQHIEIYLANLQRRQASVRPNPDTSRLSVRSEPDKTAICQDASQNCQGEPDKSICQDRSSVRLDPQSVRPGTPPNINKQQPAACSEAGSSSKEDSTVVPLTDDAEWTRRKLEPFGSHGSDWARDLAQFLRIKNPNAVDRMEKAARTYGHLNVVEAIREATGTSDVKSPSGLFGSILNRLLSTHGKRGAIPETKVEPKETNGSTYRPLTMQERTFRC